MVIIHNSAFSQKNKTTSPYEYYICISGVNTHADATILEDNVNKKSGVTFFRADRFPARYFTLRSDNIISRKTFSSWIDTNLYKIEFFEAGLENKEKAAILGKKLLKKQ